WAFQSCDISQRDRLNSILQNQLPVKKEAGLPFCWFRYACFARYSTSSVHFLLTTFYSPFSILKSILQYFLRCQHPRRAHHASAGVCAAGAEVIAFERGAEVCPLRRGAQEEDLMQQQFAVEDVAAGDTRDAFDVLRRDDLHPDDAFADVWR